MFDFGIPGYVPDWTTDVDALVVAQSGRLRELFGRHLTRTSLMWDVRRDEWWSGGPVVFDFDGIQLEINQSRFDDISITWGSIDLGLPVRWAGSADPELTWRHDVPGELVALHASEVTGVQLLRWYGGDENDFAYGSSMVAFSFGARRLTVFNDLDRNGIAFGPTGPEDYLVWSVG